MKLYYKQLNSLNELQQEKQRLADTLISKPVADGNDGDNSDKGKAAGNINYPGIILDILSNEIILELLAKLGLPVLKKAGKFAGKNAFAIGKEVFGGYIKWKALELGYRWLRRYMNKRKDS